MSAFSFPRRGTWRDSAPRPRERRLPWQFRLMAIGSPLVAIELVWDGKYLLRPKTGIRQHFRKPKRARRRKTFGFTTWLVASGRVSHSHRERSVYLTPDNKLMAAVVSGTGSSFEVGAIKLLFQTRVISGLGSPRHIRRRPALPYQYSTGARILWAHNGCPELDGRFEADCCAK